MHQLRIAGENGTTRKWDRLHPLGRVGHAEEVANLVLFLATDEASFCSGGCYRVDGRHPSPLFNGQRPSAIPPSIALDAPG